MPKNKYITARLDWAKTQLAKWETYLEDHPYHLVEDRITLKETKTGGVIPVTSASIEAQQKNQRDTMKEYLELLAVVKRLDVDDDDEEANTKKSTYGNIKESIRMKLSEDDKNEQRD